MSTTTDLEILKPDTTEPIPAADKPMQYRAVGLLWGRYVPRDEITQGILLTSDGTVMEAVILGKLLRVFLSVKVEIDLEKEHLWIVYPRTRDDDPKLHVQMAGIWEPETLHPNSPAPALEQKPDYFSIQGEVIFQNQEENWVVVRIFQQPKKPSEKPRYFKLKLFGSLPEKAVKNFWNLQVQREGSNLVVKESERVAYLGKKKPKKEKSTKGKPTKGKPKSSKDSQQPTAVSASPLPLERPKSSNSLQQPTPAAASPSPTEHPLSSKEEQQQNNASASSSPLERPKDSNSFQQPTPAAASHSPTERPAAKDTESPSPTKRPAPLERPASTKRPSPLERPAAKDTESSSPTESPSPTERPKLKKKPDNISNTNQSIDWLT